MFTEDILSAHLPSVITNYRFPFVLGKMIIGKEDYETPFPDFFKFYHLGLKKKKNEYPR